MTLTQLRRVLPHIIIEDDPFLIGYWLRWAGQERPAKSSERQEGWDQADEEIAADRAGGSIIVGASERISAE